MTFLLRIITASSVFAIIGSCIALGVVAGKETKSKKQTAKNSTKQ